MLSVVATSSGVATRVDSNVTSTSAFAQIDMNECADGGGVAAGMARRVVRLWPSPSRSWGQKNSTDKIVALRDHATWIKGVV